MGRVLSPAGYRENKTFAKPPGEDQIADHESSHRTKPPANANNYLLTVFLYSSCRKSGRYHIINGLDGCSRYLIVEMSR